MPREKRPTRTSFGFMGRMGEVPGVICDHFETRDHLRAGSDPPIFFLSHVHNDHLVGMNSLGRYILRESRQWNNKDITVYGTQQSKDMLLAMSQEERIAVGKIMKPIDIEDPMILYLSSGITLRVTAIDAEHCPGSVMFLFESSDRRTVLYTGDFRYCSRNRLPKSLQEIAGNIDAVYLDTTFAEPKYFKRIPPREESIAATVEVLLKHTRFVMAQEDTGWCVQAACPLHPMDIWFSRGTGYGYETYMMGISDLLSKVCGHRHLIHVESNVFERYRTMPNFQSYLTKDSSKATLHACCQQRCPRLAQRDKYVEIITSTIFFAHSRNMMPPRGALMREEGTIHVAFSMHCDMLELLHFIKHLRPNRVHPCVVPYGGRSKREVTELFAPYCSTARANSPHKTVPATRPLGQYNMAKVQAAAEFLAEKALGAGHHERKKQRTLTDSQPNVTAGRSSRDPKTTVAMRSSAPSGTTNFVALNFGFSQSTTSAVVQAPRVFRNSLKGAPVSPATAKNRGGCSEQRFRELMHLFSTSPQQ
eukprot:Clim_evm119s147 gene=Clim_evmTU119s147